MDQDAKLFLDINAHRGAIMAVIVAMVRDFDVADDIFQDTMVEVLEHRDRIAAAEDFPAFVKGVARNMVHRHWHEKKVNPVTTDSDILDTLAGVAAEEIFPEDWHEEKTALRHCLNQLPRDRRKLFLFRYGMNLKGPQLAEKAGIKLASLRTTLLRIRQILRECVELFLARAGTPGEAAP